MMALLFSSIGLFVLFSFFAHIASNNHYSSAFIYRLTSAWWRGAFTPDTIAQSIARMIDFDYSCNIWINDDIGDLVNEELKIRVKAYHYIDTVSLILVDNEDKKVKVNLSKYEKYKLLTAVKRWNNRKAKISKLAESRKIESLVDNRINEGYIKTIEMVEKKILNMEEANTANELRSLPPPPSIDFNSNFTFNSTISNLKVKTIAHEDH